jgi:biopolymer transport protein ExbB
METPSWLWLTHWGARLVLLVLAGLSVASVAVILDRRRVLRLEAGVPERKEPDLEKARRALSQSVHSGRASTLDRLATAAPSGAGASALLIDYLKLVASLAPAQGPAPTAVAIDRSTRSFITLRRMRLEKGLTLLATVGSNAPFIGLFGTVLGIIQAFGELSSQSGGTASVMGAISEALIATAVGLLVAIPAVIAFNGFQKKVREILLPCEILRDEVVAALEAAAEIKGEPRRGG